MQAAGSKIAVAGATGRVGRHVVEVLEERGHDVVAISRSNGVDVIIGCDRFSAGYNAAKVAHEKAHLSGPIPARVLRAAQFHEFVPLLVDWGSQGEVSYVPKMRTQLVAARTVADALADLATDPDAAPPSGAPFPEIAGPREENLVEMATLLIRRRGDPRRLPPKELGGIDPNALWFDTSVF